MSSSARLSKTEVIADFRQALSKFGEEATASLIAVDMEIRRMQDWLGLEQPRFWRQQIDICREKLAEVKSDLSRKRLANVGGHASLVEEKEAVAHIKKKMEYAEEKLSICKKWANQVERAINEYRGASHALGNRLEHELPRALAALAAMTDALNAYIALAPPSTAAPEGTSPSLPDEKNKATQPNDELPDESAEKGEAP